MSRTQGARNRDFAQTRTEMLGRLTRAVVDDRSRLGSFSELAAGAGVSRTTLRHYFGTREGVIGALIAYWASFEPGEPRERGAGGLAALERTVRFMIEGWQQGLGDFFELSLQPALGEGQLGPAFITHFLEPLLQRFEVRIADLQASGALARGSPRFAALELVSPVVLALLHQRSLGGERCRPLDVQAFTAEHFERFAKAWRP